jgi:nitrogen-specific signal transduction histidine kinase
MAVLDVLDTGPGVPDDLDIFQPFATSKDGGTGLGLSIVERIVTDHGGSIAASRRGDRTVLRVEIPVGGPRTN